MANQYYNGSGYPGYAANGDSASARSEFASIQAAFDKLPALGGGAALRLVRVNAAGTALESAQLSSAELASVVTDETGTGQLVFSTNPVLTSPNLGTPSAAVLDNASLAASKTVPVDADYVVLSDSAASFVWKKLTWANLVSIIRQRIFDYATTATAAGTTTLASTSARRQFFTGTTTQTCVLPDATTLELGRAFEIFNNSTGTIAVQASGGGAVITVPALTNSLITCTANGTAAGTWHADNQAILNADGTLTISAGISSSNAAQVSQLSGYRNKIINGRMAVDIRNNGSSQTFTAGAALAYCVDRFYGYCTGANVTGQRVAGTSRSQYRYQFTGAASVTGIGFGTRLEAIDTYDLNNNTAIFGVDLSNSLLTSVTWTAYYANTTDTFGTLASPTRTQIAAGTFTVSGTLARYAAQISIPAAATTGIEIVLSVGAQISGTFVIGDVRLQYGTADVEDNRPYEIERALCRRFARAARVGQGFASGSSNFIGYTDINPPMRIAPTATITTAITVQNGRTTQTQSSAGGSVNGAASAGYISFNFANFSASLVGSENLYVTGENNLLLNSEL